MSPFLMAYYTSPKYDSRKETAKLSLVSKDYKKKQKRVCWKFILHIGQTAPKPIVLMLGITLQE